MNPGLLNQRIKFTTMKGGKDALGHQVSDWSDYATAWANVKPLKSDEKYSNNEDKTTITYQFKIRYTTKVDAEMRIEWQGQTFEITAPPINEYNKNRYLLIEAKTHG